MKSTSLPSLSRFHHHYHHHADNKNSSSSNHAVLFGSACNPVHDREPAPASVRSIAHCSRCKHANVISASRMARGRLCRSRSTGRRRRHHHRKLTARSCHTVYALNIWTGDAKSIEGLEPTRHRCARCVILHQIVGTRYARPPLRYPVSCLCFGPRGRNNLLARERPYRLLVQSLPQRPLSHVMDAPKCRFRHTSTSVP